MKNKGLNFARETVGLGDVGSFSSVARSWMFRVIRVTRGLMYPECLGVEIVSTLTSNINSLLFAGKINLI